MRKKIFLVNILVFFLILLTASCAKEENKKAEEELVLPTSKEIVKVKVKGEVFNLGRVSQSGKLIIKWGKKGETGTAFPQYLAEENGLLSRVGIERFIPDGKGNVYLVDHPPLKPAPRFQKFSFPRGDVKWAKFEDFPATFFQTDGKGRLGYLRPKGISSPDSDLVLILDESGTAVEETLTVPSGIMPGEIFLREKDIYAMDEEFGVPPVLTTEAVANYYPVIISLRRGFKVEGNYVGWDEKVYFFGTREVRALDGWPARGKRFLFGPIVEGKPKKKYVFPWEVSLVGVDKNGYIYVVRERSLSFSLDSITREEWSHAPRFLYRLSTEGQITHIFPLEPWFEPQMLRKFYVWLGPEGDIWLLKEDEKGVEIRKYVFL